VLDELLRGGGLGYPAFEYGEVAAQHVRLVHRVSGGQQRLQLTQTEPGLLAHEDHRHAGQVVLVVAALPAGVPGGREQTHAFPVPQDMGGQPEPLGQLPDGA